MNAAAKQVFLLLIGLQVLHATEEYYFQLWDKLAPARFISGLFSSNLAHGFILANILVVLLGLWCYLFPLRRGSTYAGLIVWLWILLEFANGVAHIVLAIGSWSYFPGLMTAPLLLLTSSYLAALSAVSLGNTETAQQAGERSL